MRFRGVWYVANRAVQLGWIWPEIREEWKAFAEANERVITGVDRSLNGKPAMSEAWRLIDEIVTKVRSKKRRR